MKSLLEYINESKEQNLEPTKDNILKLLKTAYNASVNDPENKEYTIDIRGIKGINNKGDKQLRNSGASTPKDIESLAQELAEHVEKHGEDAYFDAECYWNDSEENNAESDERGVRYYDGKLSVY